MSNMKCSHFRKYKEHTSYLDIWKMLQCVLRSYPEFKSNQKGKNSCLYSWAHVAGFSVGDVSHLGQVTSEKQITKIKISHGCSKPAVEKPFHLALVFKVF